VFGPLPRLYRFIVAATTLVLGVTAGVWVVQSTPAPALVLAGIGWGLLAGLGATYLLLHDFQRRQQSVRIRRH
jgi:hypothetical protein